MATLSAAPVLLRCCSGAVLVHWNAILTAPLGHGLAVRTAPVLLPRVDWNTHPVLSPLRAWAALFGQWKMPTARLSFYIQIDAKFRRR